MSVDNTTNLNINNPGDILGNQDVNDASAPTKPVTTPITNNKGIAEVSNAENDFITTFSGTPKPSLREPDTPLAQFADKPITVSPEMAKTLGIESKEITLSEFLTLCSDKIKGDIKNLLRGDGDKSSKLDSEVLDCMVLLITMDSKSKLIQTLRDTLQAKIKDRATKNQQYIDKTAETDKKNAEEIKKKKEAEAKAKKLGILGAVLSAFAAAISCVLTVFTFGAAAPVAALAIAGCAATLVSSGLTIAALSTDDDKLRDKLQDVAMGFGIAGALLSLASGVGSIFTEAAKQAPKLLRILSVIASFTSGATSATSQIVNGVLQLNLAESQKELRNMEIDLEKLNKQVELLSNMIDKIANSIQDFMKDLFQDEEEVAQLVQQMMNTALGIEQNVKC